MIFTVVRRRRTGEGTRGPRSAVRVRPAAPPRVPLRPAHDDGARDGPVRLAVRRSRCCCRTASTSPRCETGVWMMPQGVLHRARPRRSAGRLTAPVQHHRASCASGLALEAIGLVLVAALVVQPDVSFLALLPGMVVFGLGVGFASSQLTNVILSDIDAREDRRRERRQHDRPPGRARARHRDVRVVPQRADDPHATASRASPRPRRVDRCVARQGVNFAPPPGSACTIATLRHIIESRSPPARARRCSSRPASSRSDRPVVPDPARHVAASRSRRRRSKPTPSSLTRRRASSELRRWSRRTGQRPSARC